MADAKQTRSRKQSGRQTGRQNPHPRVRPVAPRRARRSSSRGHRAHHRDVQQHAHHDLRYAGERHYLGFLGKAGFKGSKKSTPFAATVAAEQAAREALNLGVKRVQ